MKLPPWSTLFGTQCNMQHAIVICQICHSKNYPVFFNIDNGNNHFNVTEKNGTVFFSFFDRLQKARCQKFTTRHRVSTNTHWHFVFALCCHSNATRAPIANPPNSAQLGVTPTIPPKLHPGPCSSVGMQPPTGTQTDKQTRVTTIHFASCTPHAKCSESIRQPDFYHMPRTKINYWLKVN